MLDIKEQIKNKTSNQLEDMQKEIMQKENLSLEERINIVTEIEEYKVEQQQTFNGIKIEKMGEVIIKDENTSNENN